MGLLLLHCEKINIVAHRNERKELVILLRRHYPKLLQAFRKAIHEYDMIPLKDEIRHIANMKGVVAKANKALSSFITDGKGWLETVMESYRDPVFRSSVIQELGGLEAAYEKDHIYYNFDNQKFNIVEISNQVKKTKSR